MPPKFPVHPFQTEALTTTVVREVKNIWPFFFGFGVVGYAMAKISIPTEEDLKKSTITPHEDKAMASTA